MQTIQRVLAASLILALPLLIGGCGASGSGAPRGPAYTVCQPPEPGTNYQVCG